MHAAAAACTAAPAPVGPMMPGDTVVAGVRYRAGLLEATADGFAVAVDVRNERPDSIDVHFSPCVQTLLFRAPPRRGDEPAWDERVGSYCPGTLSIRPLAPGASQRVVHRVTFAELEPPAGPSRRPPRGRYRVGVRFAPGDPPAPLVLSTGTRVVDVH